MPVSTRHHRLCDLLYALLRTAVGPEHLVATDVFLYFDAANPKRALAPDGLVKLNVPQHHFESWKTWEGGTPELAFEVLSPSDSPEKLTFEQKFQRYRALGVRELVVFHADGKPGRRLRVWDRIDQDLVERVVEDERTPCLTLDLTLVVARLEDLDGLRLAYDPEGRNLVLTEAEARRAEAEAHAKELEAANRRVAELEAMLRQRG